MADRSPSPVVVRDDRVWASQWYRVRPRTVEYYELFFEPEQLSAVYGDESFQSLLLRRDGREREAHDIGDQYATVPTSDLGHSDRCFTVEMDAVTGLRLQGGSLLMKPRLEIEMEDQTHEFYHHSRTHEVRPLADLLVQLYNNAAFDVTVAERSLLF